MKLNEWIKERKLDLSAYGTLTMEDQDNVIRIMEKQAEALEKIKDNTSDRCTHEEQYLNDVATTAQTEVERIIKGDGK